MNRTHKIYVNDKVGEVDALLDESKNAIAVLVLAHGAGAGMMHHFMDDLAKTISKKGIHVLRFNFPYIQMGKKSPDRPALVQETIGKTINYAQSLFPKLPVFAGGKSFGGRMTSMLLAIDQDLGVKGLVFFGFPLHAPGKAGDKRGAHLYDVKVPMLFLQGTRDKLAELNFLQPLCNRIDLAKLVLFEGADHSFQMLKGSGISNEVVLEKLADAAADWFGSMVHSR